MVSITPRKIKKNINQSIDYTIAAYKTKNQYSSFSPSRLRVVDSADGVADLKVPYNVNYLKREVVTAVNGSVYSMKDLIRYDNKALNISPEKDYTAISIIQSFDGISIEPELANIIGTRLTKEICGEEYRALVATHQDTNTIHNHILIRPYSKITGDVLTYDAKLTERIYEINDEICSEYSFVEDSFKDFSIYPNIRSTKAKADGEITLEDIFFMDINDCIFKAKDFDDFTRLMKNWGYDIIKKEKYENLFFSHKALTKGNIRKIGGDDYTYDAIKKRIKNKSAKDNYAYHKRNSVRQINPLEHDTLKRLYKNEYNSEVERYFLLTSLIKTVITNPKANRDLLRVLCRFCIYKKRNKNDIDFLTNNTFSSFKEISNHLDELNKSLKENDRECSKLWSAYYRAKSKNDDNLASEIKEQINKVQYASSITREYISSSQNILKDTNCLEDIYKDLNDYINNLEKGSRKITEQSRNDLRR